MLWLLNCYRLLQVCEHHNLEGYAKKSRAWRSLRAFDISSNVRSIRFYASLSELYCAKQCSRIKIELHAWRLQSWQGNGAAEGETEVEANEAFVPMNPCKSEIMLSKSFIAMQKQVETIATSQRVKRQWSEI